VPGGLPQHAVQVMWGRQDSRLLCETVCCPVATVVGAPLASSHLMLHQPCEAITCVLPTVGRKAEAEKGPRAEGLGGWSSLTRVCSAAFQFLWAFPPAAAPASPWLRRRLSPGEAAPSRRPIAARGAGT